VAFSYPLDDHVAVRRLKKDLQALGINVWTVQDILAREVVPEEIEIDV